MDRNTFQGIILRTLVWGFTYYFIRRGLNPENTNLQRFRMDAFYGSFANFVAQIMVWYGTNYLLPL